MPLISIDVLLEKAARTFLSEVLAHDRAIRIRTFRCEVSSANGSFFGVCQLCESKCGISFDEIHAGYFITIKWIREKFLMNALEILRKPDHAISALETLRVGRVRPAAMFR